ncbi:MAG: hypothetical protein WAK93_19925, partial [Solirubrobacteraceae bacterium]
MNPMLNALIAQDHLADLRRTADRRNEHLGRATDDDNPTLELRFAVASDTDALHRLAALDEIPELQQPALVAVVGGEAVAALSLVDESVAANPFVPTAHLVALLRLRAEHLAVARRSRRRWH